MIPSSSPLSFSCPKGAIVPELHDRLIARLTALLGCVPLRRRLVVGVSGGLDSMLLLDIARACAAGRLPVLAVHVHHGLSARADHWAAHVERSCAAAGVPCTVLHVQVDREQSSREAAARDARHGAFATVLAPGDALLLAHHADDQAETLLLRLLRGSGLSGLGAMRAVRRVAAIEDAWLLRPFLDVPRAALLQVATQRALVWVDDESNRDIAFDRNFLRHEILPALRQRWPALVDTLTRTAHRLATADALLNDYLDADLQPLLRADAAARATLDVAALLAHPPLRRPALLRRWLVQIGAPVFNEAWLGELLALATARIDAEGELRVAGWEVHRHRGWLHAFPQLPPVAATSVHAWHLVGTLDLGAGHGALLALPVSAAEGLALAGIPVGQAVTVRFRRGGERLAPAGGVGSRPLKKLLQDIGLPPWLRQRVPLVYVADRLVAVGDFVVDADFAPAPARPASVRLAWLQPGIATV